MQFKCINEECGHVWTPHPYFTRGRKLKMYMDGLIEKGCPKCKSKVKRVGENTSLEVKCLSLLQILNSDSN